MIVFFGATGRLTAREQAAEATGSFTEGRPFTLGLSAVGLKVGNFFKSPAHRRASIFNDPSAGSPTETLLRLLLPLNDQV